VKRLLTTLLILTALSLCGLSALQWQRETELRQQLRETIVQLEAENTLRIKTEEQNHNYKLEIERISKLRAETEAKLLDVTQELNLTQTDSFYRAYSIAILTQELSVKHQENTLLTEKITQLSKSLETYQSSIQGENNTITEANRRLQQLITERDDAIKELAARTKAFNELAEKYNRLIKK